MNTKQTEPFPTGDKTDAERMQWLIRQLAMAFPSNKDWLDPALEKEAKYWATAPLLTEDPAPARVEPERLPFNSLSMGTAFRYIDQDGSAGKDIFVVLETYGNGKVAAHTGPRLENSMRQSLYSFKDEEHPMDALVEVVPLASGSARAVAGTPSSRWQQDGDPDPHAGHYDKERAELALGHLTDDELANGAFMNYDRKLSMADMVSPQPGQYMPIVWMTAVKDRIRWLSRALEKARAPQTAPSPESVWLTLLNIMHSDNGGPFLASTDDFREARPVLVDLIQSGFFHDQWNLLESDYWLAAAGDEDEAIARFPATYQALSVVLNRIFNRWGPEDARVSNSSLPERDPLQPAEEQGLFRKFDVRRVDGSDAPGGKHHGCEYFVLDVTHDQHAPAALRAYAKACEKTHPQLSADLVARHASPVFKEIMRITSGRAASNGGNQDG